MQESLLHHLWSLQYFDKRELKSTHGDSIEVFDPGILNTHAGPDFSNARLRIGPIHWVGNVEIHALSSGWTDHHHDTDRSYDTVILHVVWKEDVIIQRYDGTPMPTVELRGRVHEDVLHNYRQLISSSFSIPCQKTFISVAQVTKVAMVTKSLVQRLERKAEEILALLTVNGNNWDETTYQLLGRAFGFNINGDPFFQLAKAVPLKLIRKHLQLIHTEALLFGYAGFLDAANGDDYYLTLRREYKVLAHKHMLTASKMTKAQWKFLRLRPSNFPSLRLAQFSAVVHQHKTLFADLLELRTLNDLSAWMMVPTSGYWRNHYQFSKAAADSGHALGRGSVDIIIVNVVIPLLAAYARRMDEQGSMDLALSFLEQIPPEENSITQRWTDLGFPPRNSSDAQGQIELFNIFCQRKRCLQCAIGTAIIRPPENDVVPAPS